ncbi:ATP-dependent RNA helicase mrh4 [Penicillium sp. IBT 35674x]|nr:ATP-dependent RNA helicase mrh4 [Penicillium sp. IBT 35674x]
MATARLRRKASRMALSPDVAKHTLKKKRSGPAGPFASMNQTEARIPDAPRSRSQAALRRSGDDSKSKKPESPLYKALKMQTTLSPVTYGRRTAIKSKIANVTSFDHMPLLPAVRQSIFTQALPGLADVVPTPIQRLAIPQLLSQKPNKKTTPKEADDEFQYDQFLLAAETGSGKTLAYLLPVVDAVKRAETLDKQEEKLLEEKKAKEREERLRTRTYDLEPEVAPMTNEGRPRAIILVPTSELVAQVGEKVKALAHTVNHLVLDEADSLMDRSFIPTTMEVVDKAAPSLKKLIFCSATIPKSLDTQIRKRYPDVKRLTTPNLHAIPRRVQLGVVDIDKEPYRGNRMLACADVIWSIGKAGDGTDGETFGPVLSKYMGPKVKKIIVFVNEREEADEVAQFLQTKGIDATSLSRDSSSRKQQEILAEFTDVEKPPSSEDILLARKQHRMEKEIPLELPDLRSQMTRRLPNTRVLVTTDIASRGIDTLAVKTVVLYHVPHTTIDFIHRLGRLGRMGKRGRGVVLVGKKDRKDVVREVREGMFRGQALI